MQKFIFQNFVQNLSILSRGSLEEKLRWAFTLYDINGDGYITREEMTDIVSAVYDLMGKLAEPCIDEDTVKDKVDRIFQVSIVRGERQNPRPDIVVADISLETKYIVFNCWYSQQKKNLHLK